MTAPGTVSCVPANSPTPATPTRRAAMTPGNAGRACSLRDFVAVIPSSGPAFLWMAGCMDRISNNEAGLVSGATMATHQATRRRRRNFVLRKRACTAVVLLIALLFSQDFAPLVRAQDSTPPTPDELDQLLAPVALYPDSLLAQITTASTNPQEILDVD